MGGATIGGGGYMYPHLKKWGVQGQLLDTDTDTCEMNTFAHQNSNTMAQKVIKPRTTWVSKILNRALQSSAAVDVPRCRDIQNSMLHLFEFSLPCLETGTSTFLWLMLLLIHDHWPRRFIICSVKLRLSFAWCYGNASHVMWMRAKFQHFASAENVAEVHQDHESRKIEQHDHLSRSSGHLKFTRFNLSLLQLHSGIY